jgi:glycosyltransferase involved in cell wall biosynthesis
MQVATVTTFFPHSADPHRAVFVKNLVRAMRRYVSVDVISPIPFAPPLRRFPEWYRQSQIPRRETIEGIDVSHPRFVVVPKLDVVSGATYAAGILPALLRLGRGAEPLVVHAHCAYPDGVGAALAAKSLGLPYVVTAHGSDINVYAERPLLRAQLRRALAGADAVVAVSRDLRAKVERLLEGANPRSRLVHIPCAGFDPNVFSPRDRAELRRELATPVDTRLLVFVGQLVPIKAVDNLVEAFRRLLAKGAGQGRARLVIIGEGKCGPELERQVAAAGIGEHVVFAGALPQATVARWIAAADILCLPSHNEGTPNVIVEALASGVPVVASRVGGIPELIPSDANGVLVPPANPEALAAALSTALEREWNKDDVRRTVEHLTWDAIASKNVECLREVVGGQRAAMA